MPAQPNTAIQLNYKVGGAMVNIYADNGPEATELNKWLVENVEDVAKTQALLDAAYNVSAPGGGSSASVPAQGGHGPQQQAQRPAGNGGACAHGDYIWKDFQSKAGNQVKGWFCPSPSRTDCPAKFQR